jgi:hypothetical protein
MVHRSGLSRLFFGTTNYYRLQKRNSNPSGASEYSQNILLDEYSLAATRFTGGRGTSLPLIRRLRHILTSSQEGPRENRKSEKAQAEISSNPQSGCKIDSFLPPAGAFWRFMLPF